MSKSVSKIEFQARLKVLQELADLKATERKAKRDAQKQLAQLTNEHGVKHNSLPNVLPDASRRPSRIPASALACLQDAIPPLVCDRWVALSALQKSIRRGEIETAKQAVRTLLLTGSVAAVWNRLLVITFEDIGLGSTEALLNVVARARHKPMRLDLGSELAALDKTIAMLCEAPKDRSADLLLITAQHDPELADFRQTLNTLSLVELMPLLVDNGISLYERAAVILNLVRFDSRLRASDVEHILYSFDKLGVSRINLDSVRIAIQKTGEPICLMLPLLWLEHPETEPVTIYTSDKRDWPVHIGIPLAALDGFTRIGRQALKLFAVDCEQVDNLLSAIKPRSAALAGMRLAIFYADSSKLSIAIDWPRRQEIYGRGVMADFASAGISPRMAELLLYTVNVNLHHLNAIRCEVLDELKRQTEPQAEHQPQMRLKQQVDPQNLSTAANISEKVESSLSGLENTAEVIDEVLTSASVPSKITKAAIVDVNNSQLLHDSDEPLGNVDNIRAGNTSGTAVLSASQTQAGDATGTKDAISSDVQVENADGTPVNKHSAARNTKQTDTKIDGAGEDQRGDHSDEGAAHPDVNKSENI